MSQIPVVVFFSILMLIPGAIFPPQQASAVIDDNLYKFDTGFYEMIQEMQAGPQGQTTQMHSVLIVTDNGNEDTVESILEELGAENIIKSYNLDFVIADVPINNIATLANYDYIYKLGDGQEELYPQSLSIAESKPFIGASNIPSTAYPYSGDGMAVAVIDSLVDFTHPDLQNKKAGQVECTPQGCLIINNIDPDTTGDHGTSLAAIIAANGIDASRNGIAPDAMIYSIGLDITPNDPDDGTSINESLASKGTFALALDHVLNTDIKIVVSSLAGSFKNLGCNDYSALTIVIDRASDLGLILSMAIGNEALDINRQLDTVVPRLISIQKISCGFNYINVGSVDENRIIVDSSSKGPAQFTTPSGDTGRIKPEIVAIGENLDSALASFNRGTIGNYRTGDGGTSLANPFVTGASVLLLEKQPNYKPLQIKSALLLGADWQANVPATANDYDNRITGIYDTMNQYGFGILNIEKSLDYANDNPFPNILADTSSSNFANQRYQITANQNDQVKVLLSWFVHPRGETSFESTLPLNSPFAGLSSQLHNYDLKIQYPDGTIKRSTSDVQNNEFIIFDAPQTGNYIITVSSDGALRTVPGEPFVISSSHGIDKFPFSTTPPTTDPDCQPDQVCDIVTPGTGGGPNPPTTPNIRPVIVLAPIPSNLSSGETVTLDASASTGSAPLSFQWVQMPTNAPDARIGDITQPSISFTIPYSTEQRTVQYEFQLLVSAGINGALRTVSFDVTLMPAPPIIIPPRPITPGIAETIILDEQFANFTKWIRDNSWSIESPMDPLPADTNNKVANFEDRCSGICKLEIKYEVEVYQYTGVELNFWLWFGGDIIDDDSLTIQVAEVGIRTPEEFMGKRIIEVSSSQYERWFPVSINLDEFMRDDFFFRILPMIDDKDAIVQIDGLQIIAQQVDNVAPVFRNVSDDITVETNTQGGAIIQYTPPTALDRISGVQPVFCDMPSGINYPVGTTVITCTTQDPAGNQASVSFDVIVTYVEPEDTTPPVFSNIPDTIREDNIPFVGTIIQYTLPTATDNVDQSVDVICTPPSGTNFSVGTTTVTCIATDDSGNQVTETFAVILSKIPTTRAEFLYPDNPAQFVYPDVESVQGKLDFFPYDVIQNTTVSILFSDIISHADPSSLTYDIALTHPRWDTHDSQPYGWDVQIINDSLQITAPDISNQDRYFILYVNDPAHSLKIGYFHITSIPTLN